MKRWGADFGDIGLGDSLVYFQPVKPSTMIPSQSSADVIDLDPTESAVVVDTPLSQTDFEAVLTRGNLESGINERSKQHKRPITSEEYDLYTEILKSGKKPSGEFVPKYEMAALARAVIENFKKFQPELHIDEIYKSRADEVLELDVIFRDRYNEALEKYRGILDRPSILPSTTKVSQTQVDKYVHPMLRFGLITKKG